VNGHTVNTGNYGGTANQPLDTLQAVEDWRPTQHATVGRQCERLSSFTDGHGVFVTD
jgi:hypothetical protein